LVYQQLSFGQRFLDGCFFSSNSSIILPLAL
jgi:hypothetical protein